MPIRNRKDGAEGGNRTPTPRERDRILSPARLPVPPLRLTARRAPGRLPLYSPACPPLPGQLPDLGGIENWDLGIGGSHIAVNSAMETGMPGLYALGDFASYPGKVKTITTAVAEGLTTANSAQMYLSDGASDQHQKASG